MSHPYTDKIIDLTAGIDGTPLLDLAFWRWYLPSLKDKTRPAQHLKDRWSTRIIAEPHWESDPGDMYDLSLYLPQVGGMSFSSDVNLNYWHVSLGAHNKQIGHWDEGRWCPFCLRWDEVDAYVRRCPDDRLASACLLLLSPFVASVDAEELKTRRRAVGRAFEALAITPKDIAARAVPRIYDSDYRWAYDEERGLLLEAKYLGYTTRACDKQDPAPSISAACSEAFPWGAFRAFRQALGLPDHPDGVHLHIHAGPRPPAAPARPLHPLEDARVVHATFGAGVVLAVDTVSVNEKVRVRFDDGSERRLLSRFLTRVDASRGKID